MTYFVLVTTLVGMNITGQVREPKAYGSLAECHKAITDTYVHKHKTTANNQSIVFTCVPTSHEGGK